MSDTNLLYIFVHFMIIRIQVDDNNTLNISPLQRVLFLSFDSKNTMMTLVGETHNLRRHKFSIKRNSVPQLSRISHFHPKKTPKYTSCLMPYIKQLSRDYVDISMHEKINLTIIFISSSFFWIYNQQFIFKTKNIWRKCIRNFITCNGHKVPQLSAYLHMRLFQSLSLRPIEENMFREVTNRLKLE